MAKLLLGSTIGGYIALHMGNSNFSNWDSAYVHISLVNNPHAVTKTQVGLGSVENKSSATIRGEITSTNVTTALGYTPLNKAGDTATYISTGSNRYWITNGIFGINMNNSDLTGINTLIFADECTATEGILFPKAEKTGSRLFEDYDQIRVLDGTMYFNTGTVYHSGNLPKSNYDKAYTHSQTAHAPADAPSNAAFTEHTGNTTVHITSTERTNWNGAYSHASLTNNPHGVTQTQVGLSNVENTKLSTWPGTANITTLGTVTTGTWNGEIIANGYIPGSLTGKTYNGLTLSSETSGFTISGGTTNASVLTVTGGNKSFTGTGTGIALNGAFGLAFTMSAATSLTLPTSGTVTALGNTTTGTGKIVRENTPTLITPILGVATATSINKVTITAPSTSATLTIANGKTLTANNSITLAGTDGKTLTVNNSITLAASADAKTLNIANGGTLGSAAFTASTAYEPAVSNGTANKLWGMTSAATAKEWKSLAIGTSGTAPAFVHTAGVITLNIPSASTTSVTAGLISKSQYDTFNGKENVLTFQNGLARTGNTIEPTYGTATNTICQGNDSRLSNSRTPLSHSLIDTTGHTVSGLTEGHVVKAITATTYGFSAITTSMVSDITTASTGITKVGTIATGVWSGTAIADAKISSASTWNTAAGRINQDVKTTASPSFVGLTLSDGFSVASGSATGTITAQNLTATSTVSGVSITASGTVSGANVSATNAISGASVSTTGAVSGATVSASDKVTATNEVGTKSFKVKDSSNTDKVEIIYNSTTECLEFNFI